MLYLAIVCYICRENFRKSISSSTLLAMWQFCREAENIISITHVPHLNYVILCLFSSISLFFQYTSSSFFSRNLLYLFSRTLNISVYTNKYNVRTFFFQSDNHKYNKQIRTTIIDMNHNHILLRLIIKFSTFLFIIDSNYF